MHWKKKEYKAAASYQAKLSSWKLDRVGEITFLICVFTAGIQTLNSDRLH